jgi:hypothetical protein
MRHLVLLVRSCCGRSCGVGLLLCDQHGIANLALHSLQFLLLRVELDFLLLVAFTQRLDLVDL